jgi:hypothetical protein
MTVTGFLLGKKWTNIHSLASQKAVSLIFLAKVMGLASWRYSTLPLSVVLLCFEVKMMGLVFIASHVQEEVNDLTAYQ